MTENELRFRSYIVPELTRLGFDPSFPYVQACLECGNDLAHPMGVNNFWNIKCQESWVGKKVYTLVWEIVTMSEVLHYPRKIEKIEDYTTKADGTILKKVWIRDWFLDDDDPKVMTGYYKDKIMNYYPQSWANKLTDYCKYYEGLMVGKWGAWATGVDKDGTDYGMKLKQLYMRKFKEGNDIVTKVYA